MGQTQHFHRKFVTVGQPDGKGFRGRMKRLEICFIVISFTESLVMIHNSDFKNVLHNFVTNLSR